MTNSINRNMISFKQHAEIEESSKKGLQNKASKSGFAYKTLKKVFDRGVAAWRTGHRPGTTPAQWGMARVNAFITKKKKGIKLNHDQDLGQEKNMARYIQVLGTEAACGTSTGNGSNFGNAGLVRLLNSTGTARLVTVETSANVTIGTFTLAGNQEIYVRKGKTDEIFAAATTVLGVSVAFRQEY